MLHDRWCAPREFSRRTARGARARGHSESDQSRVGSGGGGGRRSRGRLSRRGLHREGREDYRRSRRSVSRRRHFGANSLLWIQRQDRQGRPSPFPQWPDTYWIFEAAWLHRNHSGNRLQGGDFVFGGIDAANDTRPEHGRAFFDGYDLRLQGGRACGGYFAAHFSDAHHSRGNDYSVPRIRDWSGRGRVEIGRDTSELQSQFHLVCRLLLEKKKKNN